jgi:insulysin
MDNGLECVIIKDKDANMCGACLNVYIGSVNEKIDGLAHFLEHMVFMGSKKYPDSNDFMSSINKNGGKTNAYTSDTDTNYHFTIDPQNFPVALDKFSQFFKDPLLKHEYIDKETNAVDSEAKKNLLDDVWIQLELYKTLLDESHPIKHFTCGDLDSLKIDNIEEELRKFHSSYYDAKYMTLVIFTNNDNNQHIQQNQEIQQNIQEPTYPDSQYYTFADTLESAMENAGTDEESIYRVFRKIKKSIEQFYILQKLRAQHFQEV